MWRLLLILALGFYGGTAAAEAPPLHSLVPSKHLAASSKLAPRTAAGSCTAGTACPGDTENDTIIWNAVNDTITQGRVWGLFVNYCLGTVAGEAATVTGHVYRTNTCNSIYADRVPLSTLVSLIMTPTVQGEVLAASSFPGASGCGAPSPTCSYAGEMVDADVNTAIGAAMTVTHTNATAASDVTATNGSPAISISSAPSGTLVAGETISCLSAGIPPGTTAQTVISGGTTYVVMSMPANAAIASGSCSFDLYTGFATRQWG
jgi:hypothetical protein